MRLPSFVPTAGELDQLDAVVVEIGRDDGSIRAVAYADGRVGLTFGTGEEFSGCCRDMPPRVAEAARKVLDVAEPYIGLLSPEEPGSLTRRSPVRITLLTPTAAFADESTIDDLKNGRSCLGPLWAALSEMLGPMIAALFEPSVSRDGGRPEIPGLARARRLWPESRAE